MIELSRRAGIVDVAKKAGVSIATVSRVFNNTSYVSEDLVEKVIAAASSLGYKPNRVAQSLRKGRSRTIGFLVPDIVNPFFSSIVEGANRILYDTDYVSVVCSSSGDAEREGGLLETLYSSGIDGLVTVLLKEYDRHIDYVRLRGVPVVIVDDVVEEKKLSCVASDNYDGMKRLVEFLLNTGHKTFTFLGGSPETYSGKQRMKAFLDALKGRPGVRTEVISGEYTFESGFRMTDLLREIPQAVVCGNDLIAFGAIYRLKEKGFDIPGDVSVTGFDDVVFSKMSDPPLTTARQDPYLMGEVAAKSILEKLDGNGSDGNILLHTELVIRRSTRGR